MALFQHHVTADRRQQLALDADAVSRVLIAFAREFEQRDQVGIALRGPQPLAVRIPPVAERSIDDLQRLHPFRFLGALDKKPQGLLAPLSAHQQIDTQLLHGPARIILGKRDLVEPPDPPEGQDHLPDLRRVVAGRAGHLIEVLASWIKPRGVQVNCRRSEQGAALVGPLAHGAGLLLGRGRPALGGDRGQQQGRHHGRLDACRHLLHLGKFARPHQQQHKRGVHIVGLRRLAAVIAVLAVLLQGLIKPGLGNITESVRAEFQQRGIGGPHRGVRGLDLQGLAIAIRRAGPVHARTIRPAEQVVAEDPSQPAQRWHGLRGQFDFPPGLLAGRLAQAGHQQGLGIMPVVFRTIRRLLRKPATLGQHSLMRPSARYF